MLNIRLKELREAHSLTQTELAEKLGVSKQSVSNWENDNIQPSIEMLIKMADLFAVSTDYLLDRDDKKYIEVSGLTKNQVAHVQQLVKDIVGE